MRQMWILGTANGKARVLFGAAAVREQRKLARDIDRTIGRALRGELQDTEVNDLERLALLAEAVARR
jgi:hypothetical protein